MLYTLRNQIKNHFRQYLSQDIVLFTRRYFDMVEINFNALLGRQFLPHPRQKIQIETSGRCNLACKFCAYSKKVDGKTTMSMDLFQEVVNQAADMGFSEIGLTPMTGEVFMDKGIIEKMHYLDDHPQIKSYSFFTNFVVPSEETIKELFDLHKLKFINISLYGHDDKSFCNLTRATTKEYHRLVKNLNYLYDLYSKRRSFIVRIGWRTIPSFKIEKSFQNNELQEIFLKFQLYHNVRFNNVWSYSNWGGEITQKDVEDTGLKVNEGTQVYRKGLCSVIFRFSGILADGRVNACVCRDVNGSLVVGDLKKESLSYVLSLNNPLYANLIQEQLESKFRRVCLNCDFYNSFYQKLRMNASIKNYYNFSFVKKLLNHPPK
jgi:MoaA/NifB/PqqE/SkfB family radical SAM enzyme